MTLLKLVIHPLRPRIQNRTQLRRPVQTTHQRRREQIIHQPAIRGCVCGPPGIVPRQQTEPQSGGHGLSVVEFRVRRPAGVEDVRFVPVGEVAACCGGEA